MKAMKRIAVTTKATVNADGTYTFTMTTPTPDRGNDSVDPMGGDFTAFLANPVVMYGHNYGDLPIGRVERVRQSKEGCDADVRFASEIDAFPATVERYVAAGFLKTCSIGFRSLESERTAEGVYKITKWEMLELSIVPIPMNADALVKAKGVGMVGVGEAKPPETINRAALQSWVAAKATITTTDSPTVQVVQCSMCDDHAKRIARIECALGMSDNGDEPDGNDPADLLDPEECDSAAMTEALNALDPSRLGA